MIATVAVEQTAMAIGLITAAVAPKLRQQRGIFSGKRVSLFHFPDEQTRVEREAARRRAHFNTLSSSRKSAATIATRTKLRASERSSA